jgi:hypothetical protein
VGALGVLKEGMAKTKEDGLMKFWSDKWLVLRESQLDFHKAQHSPKINFTIKLADITNVSRSEGHPFSFELQRVANPGSVTSPGGGKDVAIKTIVCKVDTDDDVYDWIDSIYSRVPGMGGVSKPTDFNHTVHVGFDPSSGAFTGLPTEWARLLNASAITKEDYSRNPAAVIEVLNFYTEKLQKGDDGGLSYPAITPPVPSNGGMSEKYIGYGQAGPSQNGYNSASRSASPSPYNEKSPAVQQTYHQLSGQKSYSNLKNDAREEDARRAQQQQQQQIQNQQTFQQQQQQRQQQQRQDENYGAKQSTEAKRTGPQYNPARAAPAPPPGTKQQQPQTVAHRQAPPAPLRTATDPAMQRMTSPAAISPQREQSPRAQQQQQQNGYAAGPPPKQPFPIKPQDTQARQAAAAAAAASVIAKPLNVPIKQATGAAAVAELAKKAEEAPLKKPAGDQQAQAAQQQKSRDQRMSTMTEAQVMQKLREVVSKEPPSQSYNKQKKIGQGASGSVYVARVRESATSAAAKQILRQQGPRAAVAIKQMDLRHQQRKELIVNEIVVMKDSKHPNIVNFIEAFLPEEQTELWVVMEFMEGGALTDVIENNSSISEDQIATISFEVSSFAVDEVTNKLTATPTRHAKVFTTYTSRTSSTATSNPTTSSSPPVGP